MTTNLSQDSIASRLLTTGYQPNSPAVARLADPIKDTPIVLTLDELDPYDTNPRTTRNPKYDEIKDSIRERGLDQPFSVTRRPDGKKHIIRNGGNTRLAILNELWQETRDERFYRHHCLFRPWGGRGEIIALTGHLAENDLRGNLMFIERAVGIENTRQLYELESGGPISQRELVRRLKTDGYVISQSHISRMQDALKVLLPAIPAVLYSGLGKHQVEKLLGLRTAAQQVWDLHGGQDQDIEHVFQDVLSQFDGHADEFVFERFQDELIGKMSKALSQSYEHLLLGIHEAQKQSRRTQLLDTRFPTDEDVQLPPLRSIEEAADQESPSPTLEPLGQGGMESTGVPSVPPGADTQSPRISKSQKSEPFPSLARPEPGSAKTEPTISKSPNSSEQLRPPALESMDEVERQARLEGHVVTPVQTTDKVKSIKQQLASLNGETLPDFNANALVSIPVQAGGLHPISDLWYIEGVLNFPHELREVITQLTIEIAAVAELPIDLVRPVSAGLGYVVDEPDADIRHELSETAFNTMILLQALSGVYAIALEQQDPASPLVIPEFEFTAALGRLMIGRPVYDAQEAVLGDRLNDAGLVKLFRLIRLARRLVELEVRQ